MKLSAETQSVLKNFATINPNIVVREGSTIKTISEAKNILGSAKIAETFPQEFGIYDLPGFLSILSMFEEPDLEFSGESVLISGEDNQSSRYFFSDTSILTTVSKDVTMPTADVSFSLSEAQLNQLRRASGALGLSEVVVKGEAGESHVDVVVTDTKNATSNTFDIRIDEVNRPDTEFSLVFNIANFKFVSGDMDVEISNKLLSQWTCPAENVQYWVALEKTSKVGV